ncbi:anti-phage ZorAB system protein ZorA [Demequina rhizosphaerae]|uniref:anti-phage ZorAB system protein ZorA n=1 Tax=Demequina rhizosphaerae TaxID=1638985 RepID=UPI000783C3E2|nr:anti-phage ZorAB system protein ZorA [Demequina rhizosphaerae]
MTTFFIAALLFIALLTYFWLRRQRKAFTRRIDALEGLISKASEGDPVDQRRIVAQAAKEGDPVVAGLWHEFDETLATAPDGSTLYNTIDADYFFNETTLAPSLINNRLLAAVPAFLTAIGVLGTFVGLWLGLRGLNAHAALGPGADTDQLLAGIETMIGGASIAFTTSVWGVALSIVINWVEKRTERRVVAKISTTQQSIDHLYKRLTPEQSLLSIRHSSEESGQALQELHERIGDRLQETVQTVSRDLQGALTGAITTAMTPAMEKLVTTTTEQSTEVFGQLVDRFASSFTDIGTKQAAALDESSTRLTHAIDTVASRFDAMVEESRRVSAELREQHASMFAELATLRDALDSSAAHLSESANALSTAAPQIQQASSSLDGALTLATTSLEKLQSSIDEQATLVTNLQERATTVSGELGTAASELTSGTVAMARRLSDIGEAQRGFQSSLQTDAEAVAETLRSHVESLESQVSKWLTDYSADIEQQIETRMGLWNTQSQDYANQMLTVAKALATVVDEIEAKAASADVVDEADTLVRGAEAARTDRKA